MFDFFDFVRDAFNDLIKFFREDIYQFFVDTFAYFVEAATLGMIEFAIMTTSFAWDVAKEIVTDIGVTQALNQAWSTIPGDVASTLAFFAIPDVINIVLSAFVTRWVLKFIPFTGK